MRTTIAHGKSRYQQKDSTLWGLASTWEMRLTGPIPRPERTLTFVLTKSLRWRAAAALLKGVSMGLFGIFVLTMAAWQAVSGTLPGFQVMGTIGFAALAANVFCAVLLIRFREGDANMRSVWLCSRNDAIGNVAVMIAAAGVFASDTGWPDIVVAVVMAGLALTASWQVVRHALEELRGGETAAVS